MQQNEKGDACDFYGRNDKYLLDFVGKPEWKTHLGDPGLDGKYEKGS